MKKCKHDWNWEPRKKGKELWDVCQLCGAEKELHIVKIEPLKGGSGIETKRERRGSSSYRFKPCSHVWELEKSCRMCIRCGKRMKKRPAKMSTSEISRRVDELFRDED